MQSLCASGAWQLDWMSRRRPSLVCTILLLHAVVVSSELERLIFLVGVEHAEILVNNDGAVAAVSPGGVDQLVHTGRALRHRYLQPNCHPSVCLAGDIGSGMYIQADVLAASSPHARSLASAGALHWGLFPSESRKHAWMPIPVYSRLEPNVEDGSGSEGGYICNEEFLADVTIHVARASQAPRLVHYSTHFPAMSCMLSLLGLTAGLDADESLRRSPVLAFEMEAGDGPWEERITHLRFWDGHVLDSNYGETQWLNLKTSQTVASIAQRRWLRQLQRDSANLTSDPANLTLDTGQTQTSATCVCPTECTQTEDGDGDDIVLEIHEKALIGAIVGAILGPIAVGVLCLQLYRLRHTELY